MLIVRKATVSLLFLSATLAGALSKGTCAAAMSSAIKLIPQAKLGVSEPPPEWFGNSPNVKSDKWTNANWLKSRFHFSFAEYSNPRNTGFGVLRVMNDDLVQPDRGFGAHPHRDVEICTYIVQGALTHKDSMGTSETLERGAIQFMTAGTGVTHSEHNLSKTDPLRFIQIWINTRTRSLQPNYGSAQGSAEARKNVFQHMVSDVSASEQADTPIKINQDSNIFVAEMEPGTTVPFIVKEGRQCYVLCMEGEAVVQIDGEDGPGAKLTRHDAAEISNGAASTVVFSSSPEAGAHVLIVEMKYERGSGRTDL